MLHQTRVRVRYAETDQMGVVYYANYLVWMEIGRVELVRAIGVDYNGLEQREGLFLAVVESHCRYLSPARYDQEVEVETWLASATPRSVDFGYKFRGLDSERLIARGSTRHVWLNRQMRVTRLPEQYLSLLMPHCVPEDLAPDEQTP